MSVATVDIDRMTPPWDTVFDLAAALKDENNPIWLRLPSKQRIDGQDTLRILAS